MKQIWKYLAAGIMGLLGFASCGKSLVDDHDDAAMYGPPPTADYKVMGTVSAEDGKPIKGIRVSVLLKYSPWSKDVEETLYSDDKGAYQLLTRSLDGLPPVSISFEDVDGEENGGEGIVSRRFRVSGRCSVEEEITQSILGRNLYNV